MKAAKRDSSNAANGRLTGCDWLISTRSICGLVDVSDRNLRRLIASDRFPHADMRLGRSLRWRASTVRAFLDNGST